MLTVVFAIYVVGLLGSLLVLGALSDHVGRRPVLGASIAARGRRDGPLPRRRGVPSSRRPPGAGHRDRCRHDRPQRDPRRPQPAHAPRPGRHRQLRGAHRALAFGALGCGALVEFGRRRRTFVFGPAAPESSWRSRRRLLPETPRDGPELASLRPGCRSRAAAADASPRPGDRRELGARRALSVPRRSVAARLSACTVTCRRARGLAAVRHRRGHRLRVRTRPAPCPCCTGVASLLPLGTYGDPRRNVADWSPLSAAGTLMAGVGFGAAALGTFGTLRRIAEPHERGELFAAAFVISYLAFSIPAVIAGFAGTDLRPADHQRGSNASSNPCQPRPVALALRLAATGRRTVERQVVPVEQPTPAADDHRLWRVGRLQAWSSGHQA